MNRDWSDWSVSRRIVTIVFIAAIAWDVAALVRLFGRDDEVRVMPLVMPQLQSAARAPLDDPTIFMQASARSPFGDGAPAATALSNPIAVLPIDQPRLTGTVVQANSSFVVMELTDGSIRLVRLGEHAAGLTLRSVAPNTGTFTDSTGRRIVLHSAPTETATRP